MKGLFTFAASAVFFLSMMGVGMNVAHAFPSGPPDGHTGSPADNFATCATAGCHDSFVLNSGSAKFSISAPDTYAPGEEINITVSFSDSSGAKHGFQLSALDAKNEHVGLFNNVDNKTQTGEGDYISHTERGTDDSSWKVLWLAPSVPADDPVTFYAAGNEANGNGTNKGDYIYTITHSMVAGEVVPGSCAAKKIEISDSKIKLLFGESGEVTVTVTGANGCTSEGVEVTTSLSKAGKKRVEISPESFKTDANGEAKFTITAKDKKGNAKVTFKADGVKGKNGKAKLVVKVRKK